MHLLLDENLLKTRPLVVPIDRASKTSIDTTLSTCLKAVGNEILHSRKNVESRVKRNVKRKLLSRSKRPATDGWRLNGKEFDELHNIYRFTVEGCCDSLGLNGHKGLPFYSK